MRGFRPCRVRRPRHLISARTRGCVTGLPPQGFDELATVPEGVHPPGIDGLSPGLSARSHRSQVYDRIDALFRRRRWWSRLSASSKGRVTSTGRCIAVVPATQGVFRSTGADRGDTLGHPADAVPRTRYRPTNPSAPVTRTFMTAGLWRAMSASTMVVIISANVTSGTHPSSLTGLGWIGKEQVHFGRP